MKTAHELFAIARLTLLLTHLKAYGAGISSSEAIWLESMKRTAEVLFARNRLTMLLRHMQVYGAGLTEDEAAWLETEQSIQSEFLLADR